MTTTDLSTEDIYVGDGSDLEHTIAEYLDALAHGLAEIPTKAIAEAVSLLADTRARAARVFLVGNGGSAATASHIACDLTKGSTIMSGQVLRAHALTDNLPLLTAFSNDDSYDDAFARQVTSYLEEGDALFAVSASGRSPNIVSALRAAKAIPASTIALVGFDGGDAAKLADVTIHVGCEDYGLIEDMHAAVGHAISRALGNIPASTER